MLKLSSNGNECKPLFTGTDDENAAATKLQAMQRGKADRARVETLKAESTAAAPESPAAAPDAETAQIDEVGRCRIDCGLTPD